MHKLPTKLSPTGEELLRDLPSFQYFTRLLIIFVILYFIGVIILTVITVTVIIDVTIIISVVVIFIIVIVFNLSFELHHHHHHYYRRYRFHC